MAGLLAEKPVHAQKTPAFLEAKALFLADAEKAGTPAPSASASDLKEKRALVEKALKLAGKPALFASAYSRDQAEAVFPSARLLVYLDSFEQAREFSKLGESGTKRVLILAEPETASPGIALREAAESIEGENKVSLVLVKPEMKIESLLKAFHPDVVFFLPGSARKGAIVNQIAALFTIGKGGTCIEFNPEKPWEFTATRRT